MHSGRGALCRLRFFPLPLQKTGGLPTKEIKQKPYSKQPRTAEAARIPKAAMKQVWLQGKEKARRLPEQPDQQNSPYAASYQTEEQVERTTGDSIVRTGAAALHGGQMLAQKAVRQRRERVKASKPLEIREQQGSLPARKAATEKPHLHSPQKAAKTAPNTIRGVTESRRGMKTAQAAVQADRAATVQTVHTTARSRQMVQQAAESMQKVSAAVKSAIRWAVESLKALITATAAAGSVALLVVLLVCMIALVAGSACGIFFAAEAPGEGAMTVQEAVALLTEEYRDRLEEISQTVPHDREELTASATACCSCRCATVTTRSISRSPSGPRIPPRWNGSSTGCSWMWLRQGKPRSCRMSRPNSPCRGRKRPNVSLCKALTMPLSRLDWTTLTATWVLPNRPRYLRSRRTRRFPARPRRASLGPRRPPPAKTDRPIFLPRCAPCGHGRGVSAPACGRNCGGSRPC